MLLRFTKMHGLGNDFMMVDLISQRANLHPQLIQELSDRKLGIGFDQLLTVRPPENPELASDGKFFKISLRFKSERKSLWLTTGLFWPPFVLKVETLGLGKHFHRVFDRLASLK